MRDRRVQQWAARPAGWLAVLFVVHAAWHAAMRDQPIPRR